MTPTPKITAVGAAGAAVTLITFAAQQFGMDLPDLVVTAVTSLLLFAAGWLRGETDPPGDHAA